MAERRVDCAVNAALCGNKKPASGGFISYLLFLM